MIDISTGGIPSAQESYGTDTPDRAFDKNPHTCWGSNTSIPVWLRYELSREHPTVGYAVMCNTTAPGWDSLEYTPEGWVWQGSNDAVSWDDIDTQTAQTWVAGEKNIYLYAESVAYKYYQIKITAATAGGSNYCGIYELEILAQNKSSPVAKPSTLLPKIPSPSNSSRLMPEFDTKQTLYTGGLSGY